MAKEKQELNSRRMKRYSDNKRKMNRILNVMIAIVFTLIVINIYFIVKDDEEDEVAREDSKVEELKEHEDSEELEEQDSKKDEEESLDASNKNEEPNNLQEDNSSIHDENNDEIIVSTSSDANVEKVIVNNNWQVTPTRQTGEHVSAFEEGHVDYEEKLLTIRNAVELQEDNIIYWSVRNDGTGKGAVAVVSSKDQSEKYRVHIKWIENAGWIPIKVEILKKIDGTYEVMN